MSQEKALSIKVYIVTVVYIAILFVLVVAVQPAIAQPQQVLEQRRLTELLPREQEITLALSAAPEHLRQNATVYVFDKSGYIKLREGTNGFTCLVNRDAILDRESVLKPTCWDAEGSATIVPMVLRVGELLAQGKSREEIQHDINQGFRIGKFIAPRKTGVAYMLAGDVEQYSSIAGQVESRSFPPHLMFYAPNVTNTDIGYSPQEAAKNPWLPATWGRGPNHNYIIVVVGEPS